MISSNKRGWYSENKIKSLYGFLSFLLVLSGAVSFCNVYIPRESPLHVEIFTITLLGKYLCLAILALSIDIVWGYCGILSLGHGAFFALGGYAMGMHLMLQILRHSLASKKHNDQNHVRMGQKE